MAPRKKKDTKKDEKKGKTMMMRVFQGGTGIGIVRGNLTPTKGYLTGRQNLWHGTPIENLFPNPRSKGILAEGLSTRFAGQNKRLNNLLMINGIMRDTEDFLKKKGIKVNKETEAKLFDATDHYVEGYKKNVKNLDMSNELDRLKKKLKDGKKLSSIEEWDLEEIPRKLKKNGIKEGQKISFKPLADEIIGASDDIAKRVGVNGAELKKHFEKTLPEYGKRLYFGVSPESVAFWSQEGKNEGHFLMTKMKQEMERKGGAFGKNYSKTDAIVTQAKLMAEGLADQVTGGYYSTIRDKLAYGRGQKKTIVDSLEDAKKILEQHKSAGKKIDVAFRTSIPTRTMHHMMDFPGIRHLVASTPSLKTSLARFLPNADPSKDLSIVERVEPKDINKMHIVDRKTGKLIEEIKIKKPGKQPFKFLGGSGFRMANLKKAVIPAALSAIGSEMVYNAVTGKSLLDLVRNKKPIEKKAAVSMKKVLKVFGYPAGAIAASSAVAIGATKALGIKSPKIYTKKEMDNMPLSKKLEAEADMSGYLKYTVPVHGVAGTGVGAGLGYLLAGKKLKPLGVLAGTYLGNQVAGMVAAQIPKKARMIETDPEHAGVLPAILSKTKATKKLIQDNPQGTASVGTAATLGLTAALPYYAAKKYYPYDSLRLKKGFDKVKKTGLLELSQEMIKPNMKKILPVMGLALPAISFMSYLASEGSLRGAAAVARRREKQIAKEK